MTDDLHKRAEDAVTRFIDQYKSGAQGCHMDADDAQAFAGILAALLARLEAVTQERDYAQDVADKDHARADKAEAALAAAYRMGLEAGAAPVESKAYFTAQELDEMSDMTKKQELATIREDRKIHRIAASIRALPVPTPAEILAQIEERGE